MCIRDSVDVITEDLSCTAVFCGDRCAGCLLYTSLRKGLADRIQIVRGSKGTVVSEIHAGINLNAGRKVMYGGVHLGKQLNRTAAVSYTHLDVYKRQTALCVMRTVTSTPLLPEHGQN